ncbi:MAG: VOC family protein [Mycobacterium sp.]
MATIDHVLAVVAVSDLEAGRRWYAALLGREPDNEPMATLAEWQVTPQGWLQVFVDPDRAGSSLFNLAVDDLEVYLAEVAGRGLEPQAVVDADKGVRLSTLTDPDGNLIRLIGGFRVHY